jgi:hypothetical protein
MKTTFCLATFLLFLSSAALAQNIAPGQAGTRSTMLATSPAFPTIYDYWDSGVQTSFSFADSILGGYPDGSQASAHAQGTTGIGSTSLPQRVSANVTSYGTNQYLAVATTYSVSEWQPRPNATATMPVIVKAHLSGSVALGGGTSLSSAINPAYVQFDINASICRVDQGDYVVEQGMSFEAAGSLTNENHNPQFNIQGDLTMDDWDEAYDGNTVTWSTDVTTNLQFLANGQETYWVIVSFIAGADVDRQSDRLLSPPITASANFGSTFTLEFLPVNPGDQMVPLPPRQLLVAAAPGTTAAPNLIVTGQPGGTVALQTSTDLQSWTDAATVSPFTGTWPLNNLSFAPASSRFFRARQDFSQ